MKNKRLIAVTSALMLCIGLAGYGNTGSADSGRSTKTTAAQTEAVKETADDDDVSQTKKSETLTTETTAAQAENVSVENDEAAAEQTESNSSVGTFT